MASHKLHSAEQTFKQSAAALAQADDQIRSAQISASYNNADGAMEGVFSRKESGKREQIDQQLNELKHTLNDIQTRKDQEVYSSFPQEIHHRLVRKWENSKSPIPNNFGGVEVPRNIEHSYKTNQMHELMSDPAEVQSSIKKSEEERQAQHKTELVSKAKAKQSVKIPSGDAIYYELSNALRSSAFPGYSWDQTYGVEKSTYTKDVFKRAAEEARPDSQDQKNLERYKYKSDEFTRWRESFFLREQQAKKWSNVRNEKKGGGN